ncbi:MAG: hypothetical protein ACT4NY_03165 [Pseudonocardiales bacterium]
MTVQADPLGKHVLRYEGGANTAATSAVLDAKGTEKLRVALESLNGTAPKR